jgi:hypothetical protein
MAIRPRRMIALLRKLSSGKPSAEVRTKSGAISLDADQTNVIAEFGADAIDIGPGTLSAGHNGVSEGLGRRLATTYRGTPR